VSQDISRHDCPTRDEWARLLVEHDELPAEAQTHVRRCDRCEAVVSEIAAIVGFAADYEGFAHPAARELPTAVLNRVANSAEAGFLGHPRPARSRGADDPPAARRRGVGEVVGRPWAVAAICAGAAMVLLAVSSFVPWQPGGRAAKAPIVQKTPEAENDDIGRAVHEAFAEAAVRQGGAAGPTVKSAYGAACDAASRLGEQGELAEAAVQYRKAIEIDPAKAAAHAGLGDVLRRQGQLDEAIACYRAAVRIDPAFAEAVAGLNAMIIRHPESVAAGEARRLLDKLAGGKAAGAGTALPSKAISPEKREVESGVFDDATPDRR
jgi:hypothetical protein